MSGVSPFFVLPMPLRAVARRVHPNLGGTVWRGQAVELRNSHGLPTAPVDRATQHYEWPPVL